MSESSSEVDEESIEVSSEVEVTEGSDAVEEDVTA
jgi:hypothetical protein